MSDLFNKFKTKKAFTMAELMIVMLIMGVLTGIMMANMKRQAPDLTKALFKKSYVTIEKTVYRLLNTRDLYNGLGFRDTRKVGTEFGEVFEGNTKFRTAFFYYLEVLDSHLSFPVYLGDTGGGNFSAVASACARTRDGLVFCIPDTDGSNINVEQVTKTKVMLDKDGNNIVDPKGLSYGTTYSYIPITVYPNIGDLNSIAMADAKKEAILIGVRFDGQIILIDDEMAPAIGVNCDKDRVNICRAKEYLMAADVKNTK